MKVKRAKTIGNRTPSTQSQNATNRYALATRLMEQGKLIEAESELNKTLAIIPNHADTINLLSIVYAHLGQYDNALSLNATLLNRNRRDATYNFNRGIITYKSGKTNDAIESFDKTIKLKDNHLGAYLYLGLIYKQINNFQQSLFYYAKSIEIDENVIDAHVNCGVIYSSSGESSKAINSFNKAISISPHCFDAYYFLGNELSTQGKLDEALHAYNKAVAIEPDSQMAHISIGNVLFAKRSYELAIRAYKMCLAINQYNDIALLNLGNTYLEQGNIDSAFDFYEKSVQATDNKSNNYLLIGNALQINGLHDKAIESYNKCLNIDRDNVGAHFNLANSLNIIERIEEARVYFENTIKLDNYHLGAYTNYALMEHFSGERNKAVELFSKIIELDPDNAQAQHMLHAIKGITPTTTPAKEYIAALFDQYAIDFENHLTKTLSYNVPAILREEFDSINNDKKKFTNAIDLGCGTGLSGVDFRDITHSLTGIDLSPNMIEIARQKNIYDKLHVGGIDDIIALNDKFDLFIATDIFVYIGDLDHVFDTINTISLDGAFFLFSVESIDGDSFTLQQSGRFAHSSAYVTGLADDKGFSVVRSKSLPLRKGGEGWITGEIYILRQATLA